MIRLSNWRIVWDAGGTSPRVLLDFGDPMDAEIQLPRDQVTDVGRPDFSLSGIPISRGNRKRRIEFSRRDEHANGVAAWQAVFNALRTDPWAIKATLSIQPEGGTARLYDAALLSASHHPTTEDGAVESVHSYAFRISPKTIGSGSGGGGPT